jgi:hypothetical protein
MGFRQLQDTTGAFLGGLSDVFEGRYNALSVTGRQKIAEKWRPELVKIGNWMLRGKPNDIRKILQNETVANIDGEELGTFFRLAIEIAKVDKYLKADYSKKALDTLKMYKTGLALEQDASSSGAQIIALTTKNKALAELSNVVPTNQKQRLYDVVAADTFNDPRFRKLNQKLGINEKDLRKAAKAKLMVSFYGAGERTGILNIERKLAKVFKEDILVVTAKERDQILGDISARAARYKKYNPEVYTELMTLRKNVRDIFNKGENPGNTIMEQLYFLDPESKLVLEKLSQNYTKVITPQDFQIIGKIMSEYMTDRTPILKDFTRWHGRLGEAFLKSAKPNKANFDWKEIVASKLFGNEKEGYILSPRMSEFLRIRANESVSKKFLKQFGFYSDNSTLHDIVYGKAASKTRRTGDGYFKIELLDLKPIFEYKIFRANKLPKSWTNIPSVNFDGKIIEQKFTQTFEEKLFRKNSDGTWSFNILQTPQTTDVTWWQSVINKDGKINDIADATKARTAYGVSTNHSNDATLVKNYHLWGEKNNVSTSTIHDAFFQNIADMPAGKQALRELYAATLDSNPILNTLNEMKARGLPKDVYNAYLNEAIDIGLIPVPGRSVIGGKVVKIEDILTKEDILEKLPADFKTDRDFYGVGM